MEFGLNFAFLAMSVSPFFRSPFTDLTGTLVTHQWYGRCEDFEMRAMQCLEAYGFDRGQEKCEKILRDFRECSSMELQTKRAMAMRLERHRQHFTGEVKKENKYATPPQPNAF